MACETKRAIEVEGQLYQVRCRKCASCRMDWARDKVGRVLAEMATGQKGFAVTLTYGGGDNLDAAMLNYEHVQKFLKRLRKEFKVRYLVAGEFGSAKGRSHWHAALIFDENNTPEITTEHEVQKSLLKKTRDVRFPEYTKKVVFYERMYWTFWKHGFVYFEPLNFETSFYIVKYALKNLDETGIDDKKIAFSKFPPLGMEFIITLATEYVNQGVVPTDFLYKVPEFTDKRFLLDGKLREIFVKAFLKGWQEKYGKEPEMNEQFYRVVKKVTEDKTKVIMDEYLELERRLGTEPRPVKGRLVQYKGKAEQPQSVFVFKSGVGFFYANVVGKQGETLWRKNLRTRAEIRQALRGLVAR